MRILLANIVPWPPTPTKSTLVTSDILFIPLSGNGLNRADLHTDRTADAVSLGNTGFLVFTVIAQGRAAGGEAFLTANARIRIDDARRLVEVELGFIFFRELLEDAGPLGDDDRRFIFDGKGPVQRFFHGLQVQGIDGTDVLDAQGFDDRFDIDERCRFPFDVIACPGVVLMAGHAGNAIIQDDADGVGAVVGHFGQGVDACMEERRIAHAGDDPFLLVAELEAMAEAVSNGESTAHTDGQVLGVERRRPA